MGSIQKEIYYAGKFYPIKLILKQWKKINFYFYVLELFMYIMNIHV